MAPVLSVNGKYIETVQHQEGAYFAVVLQTARGAGLDENINEIQCEDWGKSLASLHQLSELYDPSSNRQWDWQGILQKIDTILQAYPNEKEAMQELSTLTAYLQSLPISSSNYGLIHYDFQLDNFFYEEKHRLFNVIDVDDTVYSWYAHDNVTALDYFLNDDMNVDHSPVKSFLEGYRSIRLLSEEVIKLFT